MTRRWSSRMLVFVVVLVSAVMLLGATAFAHDGNGRATQVGWGWQTAPGVDGPPPGWQGN